MEKDKITFVEWINEWLEVYSKPTVAYSTYTSYYRLLNNHIIPYFPKVLLREVRPDMLQKHFNYLAKHGNKRRVKDPKTGELVPQNGPLSHETLRKIIILLLLVLGEAVDNDIIFKNPAEKVKIPHLPKEEKQILSVQEQRKLEQVLLRNDKPLSFAIYLALYTGLRIGELVGLKASDFDFEKKELSISRSVIRNDVPGEKRTQVMIGTTKTQKSKRKIPLPDFLMIW